MTSSQKGKNWTIPKYSLFSLGEAVREQPVYIFNLFMKLVEPFGRLLYI
jgi:hypothetical protein